MKYLIAVLLAGSMLAVGSCSSEEAPAVENKVSVNDKADEIFNLEKSMVDVNTSEEAKSKSEELYKETMAFVEEYPTDPRNAEFLFIAARAANGLGEYQESLNILNRIKQQHPDFDKVIEVYFLYAFTLDEDLKQKEKAKDAYMEVINKFPGEPLAIQSESLMEQLYMTDEELIQMLKDKQE